MNSSFPPALERQTIEEELAGGLSGIAWMNVAVAVAFIAFLSLSIRCIDGSSVFGSGATIAYLLLVVDFLVSANIISQEKRRSYAQRYHQHIVKSREESHEDL